MSAATDAPTRQIRRRVSEHDARRSDRQSQTRTELGPLLAVCGLAGGAGVTTLAYLVALAAAREMNDPVLVADTGGPSGGLAALAGVEAPRSLLELASHLATGLPLPDGIYATGPAGLRVLAAGPEFISSSTRPQLTRILDDAREAHCLAVIDCGTLGRDVDRAAAAAATHLAWVLPASERGVTRGEQLLRVAPRMADKELLVARRDVRRSKAPLKQLRQIAAARQATLVLVPHISALEHGAVDRALEEAQVAIQAVLGVTPR
jgi:MinD-like ATPase involved in chromosome partitioning or flagellar assembly